MCGERGGGQGWRHKLCHHHEGGGTNQGAAEESPCSEVGEKKGFLGLELQNLVP